MSIVEKAIDKHLQDRGPAPGRKKRPRAGQNRPPFIDRGPDDHQPIDADTRDSSGHAHEATVEIDPARLRERGVLPPADMATEIFDQFRRIKRPLLANAFGKGVESIDRGNLIMMSSALAGEGKTFSAVNLALSIANERDRTVLLIDADVAKPHISTIFDLQDKPGLLDLMLDDTLDMSDVLVNTSNPGLRLLPAGGSHEHATELLASDRMEELMEDIAGRYSDRIVVIDSPPLLQTSEAQVLSSHVGQIVLVVHAGQTAQIAVQSAIELLDPEKSINFILNKSRMSRSAEYYGGYYGHS